MEWEPECNGQKFLIAQKIYTQLLPATAAATALPPGQFRRNLGVFTEWLHQLNNSVCFFCLQWLIFRETILFFLKGILFYQHNTNYIWSVTEPILFRIDQIVSPISYIHNYVLINLTIASATRNLINKQVQFCEKLEDSLKKLVKTIWWSQLLFTCWIQQFFFVFFLKMQTNEKCLII